MKAIALHRLIVVAVVGLMLVGAETATTRQNAQPQDLMSGASLIFKNPLNPPVRPRKNQQPAAETPQEEKDKVAAPASQTEGGLADKVEDALALGNAARDRKPPDFDSAEKAYRLAWKLDPDDPRPWVGMGNLYFDQKRFEEAAKSYHEAIKLRDKSKRTTTLGMFSSAIKGPINSASPAQIAEWHSYLAAAMLQQKDFQGAELELRHAVVIDPKNSARRAQLAFALFAQNRFSESVAFYESAVRLDPDNETYKGFLKQSSLKASETAAQDDALAKQLQDTKWEIREARSEKITGNCRLTSEQRLDCKNGIIMRSPYAGFSWTVRDSFLELADGPGSTTTCVGAIRGDRISLSCLLPGVDRNEVWTKQE